MKKYKSMVDLLESVAEMKPNKIGYNFLTEGNLEVTITYQQLANRARAIAAVIGQHAKPGDRAILIYPPGIQLIETFLGCLYANVIAVPVYPPQSVDLVDKLQHIIDNAQPSICLSTDEIYEEIKKIKIIKWISKIPILDKISYKIGGSKLYHAAQLSHWDFEKMLWITTDNILDDSAKNWKPLYINTDHIAFLQYTSGSTGKPKGVMVSHGNLLSNLSVMQKHYNLTEEDNGVFWLPPYHDMGLVGGIFEPLYANFTSYLMSPFTFLKNPIIWLKSISRHKGTLTSAPNFAYDLCLRRVREADKAKLNLSSLKSTLNGAEPVRVATMEQFSKAFASCGFNPKSFRPCYGLAETTLMISGIRIGKEYTLRAIDKEALRKNRLAFVNKDHSSQAQILSSCGETIIEHKVLIVNHKERIPCATEEIGEIWVMGDSVTKGYWQNEDITAEIFKAYLASGEGPFLRTGDLGFFKDNELYICGRLKDVIIIHGRNYYPHDIEHSIEQALPNEIRRGCSIAFAAEMDNQESLIIAAEIKTVMSEAEREHLFHTILETISQNFGLRPQHIALVRTKSLKKTTSGKVRRQYTKKLFSENKLDIIYLWTASPSPSKQTAEQVEEVSEHHEKEQEIRLWIQKRFAKDLNINLTEINLKDNFFSLGLDSVIASEIAADLEKEFHCAITPTILAEYPTITKLAHYIARHSKQYSI